MSLSRRWKLAIVIAAVAVAAYPAWYLASPLFIVTTGEEDLPTGFSAVARGTFRDGEPGHPASGNVTVLTDGSSFVVRFENFSVVNGPNLHVWLTHAAGASEEYADLGPLQVTRGSSNYEVPEGIDPRDYSHVIVWCVPFNVLFGYAEFTFG